MRVLFLTHRLPYSPNRGDRIRAYHILRLLKGRASVDLVSLVHTAEERSHLEEAEQLAETVQLAAVPRIRNLIIGGCRLPTAMPLTHALLDSAAVAPAIERAVRAHPPDVVLAYCSGMARFALEAPLTSFPLVVDMVDVDSFKWGALAATAQPPMRWIYRREAKWLSRFEAHAAQRAFATVVVNERESASLATLAPGARIEVVPSGVDYEHLRPTTEPSTELRVVFCGVMDYPPNEEGAVWLAREVWPAVRTRCHGARLQLVGSNPTARVRALAADAGVEVTGEVPDVRPYLWNAAVAAAPLQVARGIQNKVLEAVAAGLPVVVTPVVAAGLPDEILAACRVAEGPVSFADSLVACLELSPRQRREMAAVDLRPLSWDRRLGPLFDLLQAAARTSPPRERAPSALQ